MVFIAEYLGDRVSLFCLSKPAYGNGGKSEIDKLKYSYVDCIKSGKDKTSFLLTIRDGNGWRLAMRV